VTVGSFEYYPFGETKVATGCRESDQRFTGKPTDAESGLQYYGARYMANSLGRFTSVDPARESFEPSAPKTWNRYAYAADDPLNLIDGDGRLIEGINDYPNRLNEPQSAPPTLIKVALGIQGGILMSGMAVTAWESLIPLVTKAVDLIRNPSVLEKLESRVNSIEESPQALSDLKNATVDQLKQFTTNLPASPNRDLLSKFFKTGDLPQGLSKASLEAYKELAIRAVEAGKDKMGVQAQRIEMINRILEKM
jgi:RHS repeat-associated protein